MTYCRDGEHEIGVYKCDNSERLSGPLHLIKTDPGLIRSAKESLVVRTLLCSTKLTQNVDLMSLLNWRANPENIPNILACLMKTGMYHNFSCNTHKNVLCVSSLIS